MHAIIPHPLINLHPYFFIEKRIPAGACINLHFLSCPGFDISLVFYYKNVCVAQRFLTFPNSTDNFLLFPTPLLIKTDG